MYGLVEDLDIGVVIAVYLLIEIIKFIMKKTNKSNTWYNCIPIICIASGAIISIIVFTLYPEGSSATNYINAFTTGAISGSAATGSNQVYKQIKKFVASTDECVNEDN